MIEKNKKVIRPFTTALKISVLFLLVSSIGIYISDLILLQIYPEATSNYNTLKYLRPYILAFLSSFIILFLVYRNLINIKKYKDTINLNLKEIQHKEIDLYQAECRINNQKSLIDSIIKSASLLILNLDKDLKIRKVDGDLSFFTSLTEENILGERLDLLFESSMNIPSILNNSQGSLELKLISNCEEDIYVLLDIKSKISDSKTRAGYTAVLIDITQRKVLEDQVHYLDYYDPLTDLPNRVLLEIKYKSLKNKIDFKDNSLAFLYIDIDDFKHINESFGHHVGDDFLVYMSKLLKNSISENDVLARITQDEFVIILPNISSREEIEKTIKNIYSRIKESWKFKNQEYSSSLTIGISIAPFDGYDFDVLLKNSHVSCEYLKTHDKGRHQYYHKNLENYVLNSLKIVNELKNAITKDQFVLYYQTVVDLKSYKIVGAEALVRWIHPERGMVPPMEFIPIIEKTNLTYELMELIVKKALQQKKAWKKLGFKIPKLSINISSKSFSHKNFHLFMEESIREAGLKNEDIILELTESGFTDNIKPIEENINYLRNIGIEIAMDDFGTGYSTLSRLKEIPIDYLKLDKSFIDNMTKDSEDEVMVKSVIALAKTFGMRVLAEGIETEDQFNLLQDMGCDLGQGYFMSKPVPSEKLYIP